MKAILLGFTLLTLGACGIDQLTIPAKNALKAIEQPKSTQSLDEPLSVEVTPAEKIDNVARSKPVSTNTCPPGAPILYRGNMMCPDRF